MKTLQYHSARYDSDVQLTYNNAGLLVKFEIMDTTKEKYETRLDKVDNLFLNETAFIAFAAQYKIPLVKVDRAVTFEMFWDKYKQKDCGRTKAEQCWNSLSKGHQIGAYDFIDAFNGLLKLNNTAKPYATTYLNQKRWIR